MQIVGLGYPAYFWLNFTFEIAYYKGSMIEGGVQLILAKDLSYQGYSGGPVVSATNGKVIGISHVMLDRITNFEDGHQHAWVGMPVSVYELESMLNEDH